MRKYYLIISLIIALPSLLSSQVDTFFNNNNIISHFIKDDTVWLTTRSGVIKCLSSTRQVLATYTPANAPIDPYQLITSVFVDQQNRMWLYLDEKGISMWDGIKWTNWYKMDAYWVLSGSGGKIVVDDTGVPWIVSAGRTPMYYDKSNSLWLELSNPPGGGTFDPFEMKIGSDGKMWISSAYGGLYRFNGVVAEEVIPPTTVVTSFAFDHLGGFYTCRNLPNNHSQVYYYSGVGSNSILVGSFDYLIQRLAVSPSNQVWAAGEFPEGVAYLENGQWNYVPDPGVSARHLYFSFDAQGRLWDTKDFVGAKQYDGAQWHTLRAGPVGFGYGVSQPDGSVWFGYCNSLSHYFPSTDQTEYYFLTPEANLYDNANVGMVACHDGSFFSATQNGNLVWYDGNGKFTKSIESDWNSYVRLATDGDGNLYYKGIDIASDLVQYNPHTQQRRTIVKSFNSNPTIPFSEGYFFDVDRSDRLWINTDKGLVSWRNGVWKTYFEPSAVLDYPEYMIAGANGVWLYSSAFGKLQYFDNETNNTVDMSLNTANGEYIIQLYVDKRNWFWCLTNANRVLCFNGHSIKIYSESEGNFPAFSLSSMFEDNDGNIWFLNGQNIALRLNIPSGLLSGQLFDDKNLDCSIQGDEPGISGYKLVFDNGDARMEAVADKKGQFSMHVPPGNYEATITPLSNLGKTCQSNYSFTIGQHEWVSLQSPVQNILYTPLLSVLIGTGQTRICNEATYYVKVCNEGNLQADSAQVSIQLPSGMSYVNSATPATVDPQGLIRFHLGTLPFDTCFDFSFVAKVACDNSVTPGQALCVVAHVHPDTLPAYGNIAWLGAYLEIEGQCSGDSVSFKVTNNGKGNTQSPLRYLVAKDQYLYETGTVSLFTQQSKTFVYAADGSTWRFTVDQEPGFMPSTASIAVEACGGTGQDRSSGYVTQATNTNGSPFEYTDCHEANGSYDPNDKQCQPKGWGQEHFIAPDQTLHYNIHFQNTGNDTAFQVVIRDTLDVNLDLTSLRLELSSHAVHLVKDPVHRALAFVFDNIRLPDSTQNSSGSQGFVQFTVKPKTSLPLGVKIHNQASIYFDLNSGIRTNLVQHVIDTGFIRAKPRPPFYPSSKQIFIYPNPATQSVWLSLESLDADKTYTVRLYDTKGTLVRETQLREIPFLLEKEALPAGVYQVGIWADDTFSAGGQIIFTK